MVLKSLRDGMRRVNAAPAVLAGVLALTFLLALPLGLVLRGMLRESLGASLAAETAAAGVNSDWWQTFSSEASGVAVTFTPRILGFGAVLSNLGAVLDAQPQALVITGAAAAYLLLWTFLVGGILDRYARNRPTRTAAFFSACGVYFFRFLRLALFAAVGYFILFGALHRWLFDVFYPWATHNWTEERHAFFLRLALYVLFGSAIVAFNLLLDYAKVRAVVEDRRSMIGALLAAFRFIRRHPARTVGLYLADSLVFVGVIALYGVEVAAPAPRAGRCGSGSRSARPTCSCGCGRSWCSTRRRFRCSRRCWRTPTTPPPRSPSGRNRRRRKPSTGRRQAECRLRLEARGLRLAARGLSA